MCANVETYYCQESIIVMNNNNQMFGHGLSSHNVSGTVHLL